MYIFLSILIVIAALLLIGAVLIQKSKGGGLASDYSQGNQYMGYRKTTDFIEKATWSLAIFICLISICASFAIKTPVTRSGMAPAPAATTAPAPAPTTAAPAPAAAPAAETPAAETPAAPAAEAPAK
ncbi:MAG: preprotein translocase subunit SecG [Muribaculaceae bacterium]|nr:preprotein translocase subunit SecG [Muribaculaceae bacterium]MDE6552524.1 preprotein translocase subunit SecG [Muribaculaceae bacterium]